MRPTLFVAITSLALLAACKHRSGFQLFDSPENAVRSLIESERAGDTHGAHQALVGRERGGYGGFGFRQVESYEITAIEQVDEDRAVVTVRLDDQPAQPVACEREGGAWRVSMQVTRQLLQRRAQREAAPR